MGVNMKCIKSGIYDELCMILEDYKSATCDNTVADDLMESQEWLDCFYDVCVKICDSEVDQNHMTAFDLAMIWMRETKKDEAWYEEMMHDFFIEQNQDGFWYEGECFNSLEDAMGRAALDY